MTRENKSSIILFRATPTLLKIIDEVAYKEDRSNSGLIRLALKEFIKNHYPEYKEVDIR